MRTVVRATSSDKHYGVLFKNASKVQLSWTQVHCSWFGKKVAAHEDFALSLCCMDETVSTAVKSEAQYLKEPDKWSPL